MGSFWEIAYVLVVMTAVIALAYLASKWLGNRYASQGRPKNKQIDVIDKLPLGQNQSIMLVKVNKRCILVGATQHHIETLCELSEEDAAELDLSGKTEKPALTNSFKDVLKSNLKSKDKEKSDSNIKT